MATADEVGLGSNIFKAGIKDGTVNAVHTIWQIHRSLFYNFIFIVLLFYITVILGWETNNKYMVKNSMGQQVFYVAEENDCCNRQFCGPLRSFVLHVQDNLGQEVMTLTRPLKCGSCCFPCCLQEVKRISVHYLISLFRFQILWFECQA